MSPSHPLNRMIIRVLSIIIIVTCLISYLVGNYFVNYALVPHQGGQDRQVNESQQDSIRQAYQTIKDQEIKDRDLWLKKVANQQETIQVETSDNLLLTGHRFIQTEETSQWILIVHGYQSQETDSFILARHFFQEGYNVQTIDLRAHGNSQGDYIGMGILDSKDLLVWTQDLVSDYPQAQIVYHGTSMGGATVLSSLNLDLPDNVKGIISDCAYTSVWDIFASELDQRFNLPAFPVLDLANMVAQIRAGYDFKEDSALEAVKSNRRPILFIHSQTDDFVPVEMAQELYQTNLGDDKELLIIDQAGHADSKYAASQEYYQKVFAFTKKVMQ